MRCAPLIALALFISAIVTLVAPGAAVRAQPLSRYSEAALSVGFTDVANDSPPIEAGFELRRGTKVPGLEIMAGVTATEESAAWVYAGARYSLALGSRWFIAPSLAAALYEQGDGKDLGQSLQFRSSIEGGRRVSERLSVALGFYHLSNASMAEVNPGSNSLVLIFAFRKADRSSGLEPDS